MRKRDDVAVGEAARGWIVRLASGAMSRHEMRRFERWLAACASHRDAFDRERRFWRRIEDLREDFAETTAMPVRRRWRVPVLAGALAASLALLLLWDDLRTAAVADYSAAVGEARVVALPDGSTAHLDTDSAIALRFAGDERRVELLRGAALFDVARDPTRPFRVAAAGGVARVVGTVFAVRASADGARVVVAEGRVAVSSPEGAATVELEAGERTAYRRGAAPAPAERTPPGAIAPWRRGKIVIDGQPLAAALAELDRYRRGRILLLNGAARARPVSGVFDVARIDEAVAALAATQGLTVSPVTPFLLVLR